MIYNLLASSASDELTDAIAQALGAGFALITILWLFRLLILIFIISIITWIIKKIWFHQPRKTRQNNTKHQGNSWISQAQYRQNMKYEYTDPYKPRNYNTRIKHNNKKETSYNDPKWYPTGWYWDEDKQSWIPPDYLSEESGSRRK